MPKTKHITLVRLCLLALAAAVSGRLHAQAMPTADPCASPVCATRHIGSSDCGKSPTLPKAAENRLP